MYRSKYQYSKIRPIKLYLIGKFSALNELNLFDQYKTPFGVDPVELNSWQLRSSHLLKRYPTAAQNTSLSAQVHQ
jgi:hypothetical protein